MRIVRQVPQGCQLPSTVHGRSGVPFLPSPRLLRAALVGSSSPGCCGCGSTGSYGRGRGCGEGGGVALPLERQSGEGVPKQTSYQRRGTEANAVPRNRVLNSPPKPAKTRQTQIIRKLPIKKRFWSYRQNPPKPAKTRQNPPAVPPKTSVHLLGIRL